mmetsp:Transcript_107703/g.214021  ORF Transcript_107703/g.214021 Transcript_107703/m.214021 type:complete len:249 (+) Transcript_107703:57-803(+)|eukprot:CAMPEP_0172713732 /NCGR_PEP_ID=MMETSP1074-20121228/63547_1 /TAXON_ID=2916 /ORGANISM="Ceratium fusus, Strain PA161109" /LENGTH=248 /DNA_ID=CAMNT_0013537925 /DNA_START=55 /DNA_END=801 /DNA_ORIENTATION=-
MAIRLRQPPAVSRRWATAHRVFVAFLLIVIAWDWHGACCEDHPFVAAGRFLRASPRTRRAADAVANDTFDPWTVLGISTEAGTGEARKAYKKLIAKYHPDRDPSDEAKQKFEQIVRAQAVITGEDKDLDMTKLLSNAVENMRNDIEFKKEQIERMKQDAARQEEEVVQMSKNLEQAKIKAEKNKQELGALGGAAVGLVLGGLQGAVLGGLVGLALKDREDAAGQVVRSVGSLAKSIVKAVGKTAKGQE